MRTSCYDICNEVFVTFKGRLDELESSSWNKWRARVWERQWQRVRGGKRQGDSKCTLCALHVCALEVYSISIRPAWHDSNDLCIRPTTLQNASINICTTHSQSEQRVCLLSHLIMHSLSLRYTHTHTPTQWQLNWKSVAYIAGLTENFLQIKCQARLLEKSNYKTEISQKNHKCCVRSRAKHFKHFI